MTTGSDPLVAVRLIDADTAQEIGARVYSDLTDTARAWYDRLFDVHCVSDVLLMLKIALMLTAFTEAELLSLVEQRQRTDAGFLQRVGQAARGGVE